MTEAKTYDAMVSAMDTWDAITCSQGLKIPNAGVAPFDVGFVQRLLGFGGINGFFSSTIQHTGVLPGAFFDVFAPGGGSFILGVTFTFVWTGPDFEQNG